MNITDQYYTENAQSFFDTTVDVDVQRLYDHFLPHVRHHGTILDAGCGSGRDSKNFRALGYKITAFDANESMVQLASKYLGQAVTHATFDTFNAKAESFDAIWACASLLHVPNIKLPDTFTNLSQWLKPQGVFYCSFKYGDAELNRNGRLFTDMDESRLKNMLKSSDLKIEQAWISSDARPGRESEQWLNAVLIKK